MALLLFASFSSMNFSNLFTLSRICWDEKEVNVMSLLLIFYIYLTCDAYQFFSATSFHGYSLVVVKLVLIVNLCLTSQLDIFCNLRLGDSLPLTQV